MRVVGFAGIGRPAKFFASLRQAGAEIAAARPFPDHHRFTSNEITGLRRAAERAGARLVTTEKDWVRLPAADRGGIEAFEVELCWRDPAAFRSCSRRFSEAPRQPLFPQERAGTPRRAMTSLRYDSAASDLRSRPFPDRSTNAAQHFG